MLDQNSSIQKYISKEPVCCIASPHNVVRQVATKCAHAYSLSDGVQTTMTYRAQHTLFETCYDIAPIYRNSYVSIIAPYDTPGLNDITVKSSIECDGVVYPLTFGGQPSVVIKPGCQAKADPLGIHFPAGSTIYTRNYVEVTSGQKFPKSIQISAASGEGSIAGDKTASGTVTAGTTYAFLPIAIVGNTTSDAVSIGIFGDSIAQGTGDVAPGNGFIARAIKDRYNWGKYALASDKISTLQNPLPYRFQTAQYFTDAICEYAVNDISAGLTVQQVKTALLNMWNILAARGCRVYQTTITPKTSSTDGWQTASNQTINMLFHEVRTIINDWIRTDPAPLSGHIEVADRAETKRNSGIWYPGLTDDGTHPNENGHIRLSDSLSNIIFK